MPPVLTVPGIFNSGPAHWQSIWETRHPDVQRVLQRDWDYPVCSEWAAAIDAAVARAATPPILVAHSLGCLALAHWAAASERAVAGLLLVAVPDPAGPAFPPQAQGFGPPPRSLCGRSAVLVASRDDPYSSAGYTERISADWSVQCIDAGAGGHLNADSGLGAWDAGWAIVQRWRAA